MNPRLTKGFVLIEMLAASLLLSLAGAGLYAGLMQGVRTDHAIGDIYRLYDPLRIFWKKLEKDLRNSVYLTKEVYAGKQSEMRFPVLFLRKENGKKYFELRKITYVLKDGVVKRSDQQLSNLLAKEEPNERVVLKKLEGIRFQYPYLDIDKKMLFRPFWLEEPYFGIPKAVKVDVTINNVVYSKLISIPQGRWGRVQPDEISINE